MTKVSGRPYAHTRLVSFLEKRILELRPRKSQAQIATASGFTSVNMLAMLKTGACKLPLDRVSALARSLEIDPAILFAMAVEQQDKVLAQVLQQIYGTHVTANEQAWLELIREASDHSDPTLTIKARRAILAIFGK